METRANDLPINVCSLSVLVHALFWTIRGLAGLLPIALWGALARNYAKPSRPLNLAKIGVLRIAPVEV